MACNCNSYDPCNNCQLSLPCGCPPDYNVTAVPVPCGCCPTGYTFRTASASYPNGICINSVGATTPTINCPQCEESVSSDCVILPAVHCFGITAGTTLTQFVNFFCSDAFIENILTRIGLNPVLGSGLCQLVAQCPPSVGGTSPVITSITVHFP